MVAIMEEIGWYLEDDTPYVLIKFLPPWIGPSVPTFKKRSSYVLVKKNLTKYDDQIEAPQLLAKIF